MTTITSYRDIDGDLRRSGVTDAGTVSSKRVSERVEFKPFQAEPESPTRLLTLPTNMVVFLTFWSVLGKTVGIYKSSIGLIGRRQTTANSSPPQDLSERPSWEREILDEGMV